MDKNLTQDIAENFVDLLIEKHGFDLNAQKSRIIEKELVKLLEGYALEVYSEYFRIGSGMSVPAKVKTQEFIKNLNSTLPLEARLHLPFGLVKELVYKLLLEHERDTRYEVIDVLRSMENYDLQIEGRFSDDCDGSAEGVDVEEAVKLVHNLSVGSYYG